MFAELRKKALVNSIENNKKLINKFEKAIEIKPKEKKGLFRAIRYQFRITWSRSTGSQYSIINKALQSIYFKYMLKYLFFGAIFLVFCSINFVYKVNKQALGRAKITLEEKEKELENMKRIHPQLFQDYDDIKKESKELKEEKEFSDWSKYDGSNRKYDQNDAK